MIPSHRHRTSSPPSSSPNVPSQPGSGLGSISKQSVHEIYSQIPALPIARCPLFPGFSKGVVLWNPAAIVAIKEMMKRGQSYLSTFLFQDENMDSDVITDVNSVQPLVSALSRITLCLLYSSYSLFIACFLPPRRHFTFSSYPPGPCISTSFHPLVIPFCCVSG